MKKLHKEIIKFIGCESRSVHDVYYGILVNKDFSKRGLNLVNFDEAMKKLDRDRYIVYLSGVNRDLIVLSDEGMKVYRNLMGEK